MKNTQTAIFPYLLILTGIFFLLEISFLIQSSGIYLGDYQYIAAHLKIPTIIIPGILFFICAQLFVHLLFTAIVWAETKALSSYYQLTSSKALTLGVALWFLWLLTVLSANQLYFPNSKFADLTLIFFPIKHVKLCFDLFITLPFIVKVLSIIAFFRT